MALDLNHLRAVARGTSSPSGSAPGPTSNTDRENNLTNREIILIIVILVVIFAGLYWWRYVVVPLGALISFTILIRAVIDSSIELSKKWTVGVVGTLIIAFLSVYLWNHKWPGSDARGFEDGFNAHQFAEAEWKEAKWKCKGDVNIREGDGINSPGKGSRTPKRFTQHCDGQVWVRIGSESPVVQTNGIKKTWVRVRTPNGEGWVNGELLSY